MINLTNLNTIRHTQSDMTSSEAGGNFLSYV